MARTEEEMATELTGMAAPMAGDEGMPMEEESTTIDAMSMVANFQQMSPEEQDALRPLFQDPVRPAMEVLLGAGIVNNFIAEAGIGEAEAGPEPMAGEEMPMPPAGEGMMAPEAPMPAMARGGMLNTQMKDMVRQGMSPQEIRTKLR